MNTDLQKANMWKRMSAWLFDVILLATVVVFFGYILSSVLGFTDHYEQLNLAYEKYESQFGIEFHVSQEAYDAMDPEQQQAYEAAYNQAYEMLIADGEAMYAYGMVVNLSMLIASISVLLGYLVMEFAVPLWLGNGQTLGKKIFAIGIMRTDSIKLTTVQLFIRTILGKYALGTMVPIYVILLLAMGTMGIIGIAIVAGLLVAQAICLIAGGEGRAIQDRLAGTIVVDIASQRIFRDTEDLINYTKTVHAQQARDWEY